MTGKVALISGGARGIGRAMALSLADRGWSVAICYRTSHQQADETITAVTEKGVRGMAEQCDISNPMAAAALARKVQKEWGRIDTLLNCAGPYHRIDLLEETVDGWLEMSPRTDVRALPDRADFFRKYIALDPLRPLLIREIRRAKCR